MLIKVDKRPEFYLEETLIFRSDPVIQKEYLNEYNEVLIVSDEDDDTLMVQGEVFEVNSEQTFKGSLIPIFYVER